MRYPKRRYHVTAVTNPLIPPGRLKAGQTTLNEVNATLRECFDEISAAIGLDFDIESLTQTAIKDFDGERLLITVTATAPDREAIERLERRANALRKGRPRESLNTTHERLYLAAKLWYQSIPGSDDAACESLMQAIREMMEYRGDE